MFVFNSSGPWIQGTGSLAVTAKANGEIWLENRNGIIMRLNAAQAGLTFSQGRYELTHPARRRAYPVPPGSMRSSTPSRRTK
jgi:hypothetical protein